MRLSEGTRLGPYELSGLLGAGGMGEVYRARDPRLDREVAIKVLPEEVASDPDRLRRFEKEARAAASLTHPSILDVHDVGTHDGRPYLVTELLEGETLREHLAGAPLPVPKAIDYALQIARGLVAAHDKGIVHRDLKPENLFVTREGPLKILDFGLAKLRGPEGQAQDSGHQVETVSRATDPGTVMGTAGYMSPEQVRGQAVDQRSDIFAFGAVLYEMLSGRRAFQGDSGVEVLNAILKEQPPRLLATGRRVPPALDRVVRRCLEKRPEDRYASSPALMEVLESLSAPARGDIPELESTEERGPYPGLSAFTEADAEHFFGREAEVEALWKKVQRLKLLGIIGPSGAGKTSFLRAGLVASCPGGWAAMTCTPGTAPYRSLGQALVRELAGDVEAMERILSIEEPATAIDLLRRWRRGHGEALLVVDQFEELFTLNPPEVQARFAELLGRLASEADVHVLLSMRDDFLFRCHAHETLAPVFAELTPLGPPVGPALRSALVEPAQRNGFAFEDEALVEEMLGEVSDERGALPLLAFAVARLWERRDREKALLTREAYAEIGGVGGALAQHAEATLGKIGSERQGIVREIFRNLATSQGTRAVIDREELLSAFPEREAAETVLGQLVDARLLTSYAAEGKEEGEPTQHRIEIVHESLLSAWPRLVRWQAQDEEGALLRDQLKQAAHLWEEKGRTPDLLWSGTAFREFELWRERYPGALTAVEGGFASAMETNATRRRRRRRAAVAMLLTAAAAVAAVTSALWQRSNAARRRAEAEVRQREAAQILSLGRLRLEGHPTAALAHALASLERSDNQPARRFAVEALWKGPMAHFVTGPDNPMLPSWSPDGRWLAVAGTAGLFVLDQDGGKRRLLEGGKTELMRFSAEGSRLVTSEMPNVLHVWSLPELERLETLQARSPGFALVDQRLLTFQLDRKGPADRPWLVRERSIDGGPERIVGRWPRGEMDSRGEWLVSIEDDRIVRRRVEALDAPPQVVGRHEGDVRLRIWDGTGRVVTADDTGEIRVWDAEGSGLVRTFRRPTDARRLLVDPSGRYLATAPGGPSMPVRPFHVFDLEAPTGADPVALINDELHALNAMSFHPAGHLLASGNFPHGVLLWNLAAPRSIVLRGQKGGLPQIAFTPDGRLVSTSSEGVARLWPLWSAPEAPVRELWSGTPDLTSLDVSPDGRFAVVGEEWGTKVFVVPLDGSETTMHEVGAGRVFRGSIAPDGRHVALLRIEYGRPEAAAILILDLETGGVRTLRVDDPAGGCVINSASLGALQQPHWLPDGRLVSEGTHGLRLWDLADGSSRQLRACPGDMPQPLVLEATPDSATILTLFHPMPAAGETSTLMAFELATGVSREITWHGSRVSAFAVDSTGTILATGDADGLVRVGPFAGGEPHLFYGHSQLIRSIDVSPDGRWIASASNDETIRLWPMPDVSKPPLHALPHKELLAKLRSFTNLRVVRDEGVATGYRVEPGPFPGWETVPTW